MRRLIAIASSSLVLACGSSVPLTTTVPPGVTTDSAHPASCRLSDGTDAADGVAAQSDDDCNECTCHGGHWQCTERDCGE